MKTNNKKTYWSENIRLLRLSKSLTQENLAKILHISRRTIDSYENEARNMPIEVLIKYSDYFNVSTDEIIKKPINMNANALLTTGQKIRYFRKSKHLTIKEFSKMLNKSYEYVVAYENDRRKPKIETIKKIANILNVSYQDLI